MNTPAQYLQASFRTLDKHKARGKFNTAAALRLLINNARDIAPGAPPQELRQIAQRYLHQWYNRATQCASATTH